MGQVNPNQKPFGQYAYSGAHSGFHIFMESRQVKTWRYSSHIREKGKLPPGNPITEFVGKPGQRLPLWDETIFCPIHPGRAVEKPRCPVTSQSAQPTKTSPKIIGRASLPRIIVPGWGIDDR